MRRPSDRRRLLRVLALGAALPGTRPAMAQLVGGPLYELPAGVETRWASPENPTGAKGQAGQALAGRKGAPTTAGAGTEDYVGTA